MGMFVWPGGGGRSTKIPSKFFPVREDLFTIFAPAVNLTMDVLCWLSAFVHQLGLVQVPTNNNAGSIVALGTAVHEHTSVRALRYSNTLLIIATCKR
jgi:hypothetical protein